MKLPGDFVAANEEYVAGKGVFEASDGIYSAVAGELLQDHEARTVSVKAAKLVRPLRAGDPVYALVQNVYDSVCLLTFQPVRKGVSASSKYAYMRISEVTQGYAEKFRDYLRIGDYLKARVKEVTPLGIYLTMADSELGVIKAFCTNCHGLLVLENGEFHCSNCGGSERRKYPGAPQMAARRRPQGGGFSRGPRDRSGPRGSGGFRGGSNRGKPFNSRRS
ncbi:MAG: exosome complex RNA-binding protein Csl4 [Candidatus Micrarchaeota archaeon]